MKPSQDSSRCPSKETLNEVYDGECCSGLFLEHVKHCIECTEYLESLAELDRKIGAALDHGTPGNISERCLTVFHDRLENKPEHPILSSKGFLLFSRATAAVTLVSLTGFLIWRSLSGNGNAGEMHPERRLASSAGIKASLAPAGTIRASDLEAARFSSRENNDMEFGKAGKAVEISSEVSQVWTSPKNLEIAKECDILEKLLKENGIQGTVMVFPDSFKVNFKTSKQKCVVFVRACRKNGYLLDSPIQPQPEQENFLWNKDDEVRYQGHFIRR